MSLLASLGLAPLINAYGTNTRLSAGPLDAEVAEAMREAARASVDVLSLQAAACREIRAATGAEAGFVTAGAAAGLMLAAAACIAGLDPAAMNRLPRIRREFLISRSQRNMYDRAIEVAGGVLVDVGIPDRVSGAGVRDASVDDVLDAITAETAGILYVAQPHAEPSLRALCAAVKPLGVPVIVDAAAQLPPAANLRRFLQDGADLVVFSGGKAIGGPQASGLLCGRADLVASALAQMLDLDLPAAQFRPQPEFAPLAQLRHLPRTGVGRVAKVGREEVLGLIVALRRFVAEGDAAREARWRARLAALRAAAPALAFEEGALGPVPALFLRVADAPSAEAALRARSPAVHVNPARLAQGLLGISPIALGDNDIPALAAALQAVATHGEDA